MKDNCITTQYEGIEDPKSSSSVATPTKKRSSSSVSMYCSSAKLQKTPNSDGKSPSCKRALSLDEAADDDTEASLLGNGGCRVDSINMFAESTTLFLRNSRSSADVSFVP